MNSLIPIPRGHIQRGKGSVAYPQFSSLVFSQYSIMLLILLILHLLRWFLEGNVCFLIYVLLQMQNSVILLN